MAEEFDGYISDMSISKKEAKTGYITIRVPQKNFYLAIERIDRLGEVKNKNIKSEDVTEQYIDLKARLENVKEKKKFYLIF
jgi:ABC-type Fe3+-hydroxamate transport system substrate-binding protein